MIAWWIADFVVDNLGLRGESGFDRGLLDISHGAFCLLFGARLSNGDDGQIRAEEFGHLNGDGSGSLGYVAPIRRDEYLVVHTPNNIFQTLSNPSVLPLE